MIPSEASTSGRINESDGLQERRPRDSIDIYTYRMNARAFGHDVTDCPMMGGDDMDGRWARIYIG